MRNFGLNKPFELRASLLQGSNKPRKQKILKVRISHDLKLK